jgi:DNA-binding CsgD family transcriptional regulator
MDRIERLLGLLVVQNMKSASQREKAAQLSIAGFTNIEIADLLGTTAQVIAQHLYVSKKSRRIRKH